MYKEVLDYIRDLGKERALPEKDRQKERQEEVCECMNMIADEICRIYGSYGFTWNRDGGCIERIGSQQDHGKIP